MQIRYVKNEHIDREQWDECIRTAVNGRMYAYTWYLDIMSDHWDALVEGDYETVFPLTYRTKMGITYLHQPFFTQQLGIFSRSKITPELVNNFLKAIPAKFRFAEINLNMLNKPDTTRWKVTENDNYELDLIEPFDAVYDRFSTNIKRNVSRAEQNNIKVSDTVNPADIVQLFRENRGSSILNLKDKDYQRFLQLVYLSIHKKIGFCFGAFTPFNTLCAGMIILISHNKATFLFSATNQQARDSGAMSMLISQFIYSVAGNNLTLDFEGSNDPSLARFYRSFGAAKTSYPSLSFNHLPFPLKQLFPLYKKRRIN
ncbi:MAG: hypothetical protein WCQ70_10595 [Lentimicrobiaceae bacterium]